MTYEMIKEALARRGLLAMLPAIFANSGKTVKSVVGTGGRAITNKAVRGVKSDMKLMRAVQKNPGMNRRQLLRLLLGNAISPGVSGQAIRGGTRELTRVPQALGTVAQELL